METLQEQTGAAMVYLPMVSQAHARRVWARIWRGRLHLGGDLEKPRQGYLERLGWCIRVDARDWRILGAWRKSRAFGAFRRASAPKGEVWQ